MNFNIFKKVFTDLGLPEPDLTNGDYKMNAKEYSLFMKVLYNGSYLTSNDSEFCTEMLSQSDFNKGIKAGVPANCIVANKFGEGGDMSTKSYDLSESGLIENNNITYLLTIMMEGYDMKSLVPVLRDISQVVYNQLQICYKADN